MFNQEITSGDVSGRDLHQMGGSRFGAIWLSDRAWNDAPDSAASIDRSLSRSPFQGGSQ
jgi:hypothetical protein